MRTRETTSSRSKNNNSPHILAPTIKTEPLQNPRALESSKGQRQYKEDKISSEHEGKENNPFSLNNKILYLYLPS